MADDKERLQNILDLRLEDANEVPSVYTNQGRVQITQWDFRFMFSEIIVGAEFSGTEEKLPSIRHVMRANVVMSPAHAKAFAAALMNQVNSYEKAHGEIKIPVVQPPAGPK